MNKTLVMFSGGLTSRVLLNSVNRESDVTAVIFDYNQEHRKEVRIAKWVCLQNNIPFKVFDIRKIGSGSNILTIMAEITKGYAQDTLSNAVYCGVRKKINFFGTVTPFDTSSLKSVLRDGLSMGVDLEHTWDCLRGLRYPCGECFACIDRAKAFHLLGENDPLPKQL